jgi:hypothetical protein
MLCAAPSVSAAEDSKLIFDAADGHEWIGEPFGAPVTTSVVEYRGRRCLECTVTAPTGNYALVRTKRFPLESWRPTYRAAQIDVFVTGANPTSRLKLEVRGATFDPVIHDPLSQRLPAGRWITVTWDLSALAAPVGALSIILDDITGRAPTAYLDNLRLVSATGPRVWDSMDGPHNWFYFGNWYNWTQQPLDFPGLDAVSSLDGAPKVGREASHARIPLRWRSLSATERNNYVDHQR